MSDNIIVVRFGYIIQVLFEMIASHLMALEVPFSDNFHNYMKIKHPGESMDKFKFFGKDDFTVIRYDILDDELEPFSDPHRNVRVVDATTEKLRRAVHNLNDKINLNYDFGDDWWVSLTLEKIIEDKDLPGSDLPRVIDGAGFGIIEDVGGTGGLEDCAKAFRKKKGTDYKRYSDWLGVKD